VFRNMVLLNFKLTEIGQYELFLIKKINLETKTGRRTYILSGDFGPS
jgi:hypothetical protein